MRSSTVRAAAGGAFIVIGVVLVVAGIGTALSTEDQEFLMRIPALTIAIAPLGYLPTALAALVIYVPGLLLLLLGAWTIDNRKRERS